MFKAYRFRIYPDREQLASVQQIFSQSRQLYNHLVERHHASPLTDTPSARLISRLVDQILAAHPQIGSIDPSVLDHTCARFRFSLARSQALSRRLQFRGPNSHESFCLSTRQCQSNATGCRVLIQPLGAVKARMSRLPEGQVLNVTIIKTRSGRYYASVLTRQPDLIRTDSTANTDRPLTCIGLDMGISHFLTQSDGQKIGNPRYYEKTLQHIGHQQRNLERKSERSANRQKQARHVARLHERIHNQRMGFLHQESSRIVRANDIIAIESLGVQAMLRQKNLSLQISDAAWQKFTLLLQYKAQWYGKTIIPVGRYFPSSKICCKCRFQMAVMPLEQREWICPHCGTRHDRDINAAINILQEGARQYLYRHPEDKHRLVPVLSASR